MFGHAQRVSNWCRIIDSLVQSDRQEPEREDTCTPDHRGRTETCGRIFVTYGHIYRSSEIRKVFLSWVKYEIERHELARTGLIARRAESNSPQRLISGYYYNYINQQYSYKALGDRLWSREWEEVCVIVNSDGSGHSRRLHRGKRGKGKYVTL